MDKFFDDIGEAFSDFNGGSVLEIAILAGVIFFLLHLVRGTTAMPVVRGVGIVTVAIVVLGRVFDLEVINWLVRNALAVLVIFVLVVFQPEFRRALERVGRAGLRSWLGAGRDLHEQLVEVVSKVAEDLARQRAGALMVIERETGLQEIVETGVAVDALPTPELLAGIFYPNAPLHDGAVVLRADRVLAASCTLPLSNERRLQGGYLGTRHRAALGISERSDALVVVVSEETGTISVASGGRLTQRVEGRRLRPLLQSLLNGAGRIDLESAPAAEA